MTTRFSIQPPTWTLEVDPILCRAHGLCAELVPEIVDLDEWGYPILSGPVPGLAFGHARAAVRACPTLALRLARTNNG
jgi:ferredoxin